MSLLALLLALAAPASAAARPSLAGARRWACFYGADLSSASWRSLDLAVVDPDNYRGPLATGPVRLAYVSAGEADDRRAWWPRVQGKPFLVEPDPDWPGAMRADVRDPAWRALVEEQVSSALARGYDGVMLDTLDVAEYLESSAPVRFAGSIDAAASLVADLRLRHPDAVLVVNNALAPLSRPAAAAAVDGVVAEDVFTRCPPGDKPCAPTPEPDSGLKARALSALRARGTPVFVLLYSRFDQRRARWVQKAAARCRRLGFFPYLAAPDLGRLGLVDPFAP
ncbi:MAG: endo alpha-1,4 polygalactosaminidase [Elusimicrobia bacterium]|nr:endo alpha-1,4 polygalactosaminidase [Elusimicrobiota bacterium]